MDPISITTSAIGTAAVALHSARRVNDFIDGIQGAPRAVSALSKDLQALKNALEALNTLVNQVHLSGGTARSDFIPLLKPPLENCATVLESIILAVKPYTKPSGEPKKSKWRGFVWTFREQEVVMLQKTLMDYKMSLDIAISVANLTTSSNGLTDIKKSIRGMCQRLNEDRNSISDSSFSGSGTVGTDHGYALRRYLLETETVLGDSPPFSPEIPEPEPPVPDPGDDQSLEDWTPVHVAAQMGHHKSLRKLLKVGGKADALGKDDVTPLHLAAGGGHLAAIRELLAAAPNLDPSPFTKNGSTPLHFAAENGHLKVFDFLRRRVSTVSPSRPRQYLPIHLAALNGHLRIVERLLDIGNISAKSRYGILPIHLAARAGHLPIVRKLHLEGLRLGLSVDVPCTDLSVPSHLPPQDNLTALYLAVAEGHLDVVEYLISKGANTMLAIFDKSTLLHAAAWKGSKVFALLLQNGLDPFASDSDGEIPFHVAAKSGNLAVAEYYLELADAGRINLNLAITSTKCTPLHLATANSQTNLALKLMERGANCNTRDSKQVTPLMNAARLGLADLAQKFIESGDDIEAKDIFHRTALHEAVFGNSTALVQLLLENGANKNAQDMMGSTPYLVAAERSFAEVMTVLTQNGVDASIPNRLGFVATDYEVEPTPEDRERRTTRAMEVIKEFLFKLPDDIGEEEEDLRSRTDWNTIEATLLFLGDCFQFIRKKDDLKVCVEQFIIRGSDGEPYPDFFCTWCLKDMTAGPVAMCSSCNRPEMCSQCNEKRLGGDIPKGCKAEHEYWTFGGEDWQRYPPKAINLQGDKFQDWIAVKKVEYGVTRQRKNGDVQHMQGGVMGNLANGTSEAESTETRAMGNGVVGEEGDAQSKAVGNGIHG